MASSTLLLTTLAVLLTLSAGQIIPAPCSVSHCGTYGAQTACMTHTGLITCAKWSTTKEAARACGFKCTNSCYFVPVYGSDGNPYCSPCHLHQYSCRTGFKVYGPVPHPGLPTSRLDDSAVRYSAPAPVPAAHNAVSADQLDEESVRRAGPSGGPAVHYAMPEDQLDEESVRRAGPSGGAVSHKVIPPTCSMELCTLLGAKQPCLFGKAIATCLKFSATAESKKQCSFFCPDICLPNGPVASDGKKYCSLCHLRQASCRSHYKIFGPVVVPTSLPIPSPIPLPTVNVCSMKFCTANGANARCLRSIFNTVFITCKTWAKAPEKDEQCAFACPAICLPEDERPIDNTGTKHCSLCQLQSASCAEDFAIFGPIKKPTPTHI